MSSDIVLYFHVFIIHREVEAKQQLEVSIRNLQMELKLQKAAVQQVFRIICLENVRILKSSFFRYLALGAGTKSMINEHPGE